MRKPGINPLQWQVDSILESLRFRPACQIELISRLGLERNHVFKIVGELERKKKIRWDSSARKFEVV